LILLVLSANTCKIARESAFSWIKRAFGEYVTAKNLENMIREITIESFYTTYSSEQQKQPKKRMSEQR